METVSKQVGFVRAKQPTVCRSRQKSIEVGELIARPASCDLVALEHKTRVKWCHPKRLERHLAIDQAVVTEAARQGYVLRRSRKEPERG